MVRTFTARRAALLPARLSPWLALLENAVQKLAKPTHDCYLLLDLIREHHGAFDESQQRALNSISRTLLEAALSREPRFDWYVRVAVLGIMKTYGVRKTLSRAALRPLLQKAHLRRFGFRDAPVIASEIGLVIDLDPRFATNIYKHIFAYKETSTEKTVMNPSRIFGMSSNVRQDYEMAHFYLEREYARFLEQSPEPAIEALAAALRTYERSSRRLKGDKDSIRFSFRSVSCRAVMSYAPEWDRVEDQFRHDSQLKMIDMFYRAATAWANTRNISAIDGVIVAIARSNQSGFLWRRLLMLGAEHPEIIGTRLVDLMTTESVLLFHDTSHAAGACIEATFPILPAEARTSIEQMLVHLAQDGNRWHERLAKKILRSLASEDLILPDSRELRETAVRDEPPEPTVTSIESSMRRATLLDEFDLIGGMRDAPQALRDAIGAVDGAWEDPNRPLSQDEIALYRPLLLALRQLLHMLEPSKAYDYGWSVLAAGLTKIVQSEGADAASDREALDILIEASRQRNPEPDSEHDEQFNEHQSWGSPAARTDATMGLLLMLRHFPDEVTPVLEKLSSDSRAEIRYLIARYVSRMADVSASWRLAEWLAADENRGVLAGLVDEGLLRLYQLDRPRALQIVRSVFDRMSGPIPYALHVRQRCTDYFVDASLSHNDEDCTRLLEDLPSATGDAALLKHVLLQYINYASNASNEGGLRKRAMELVAMAATTSVGRYRRLRREYGVDVDTWTEDARAELRASFEVGAWVAERVYFACGIVQPGIEQMPNTLRSDIFKLSLPTIEIIADSPEPRTTQHIVETLSAFSVIDPKRLFRLGARAIRAGAEGGYALEFMAADAVAKFVRQYIADYHDLLESDDSCRSDLIDVIDTFVRVGWPQMDAVVQDLQTLFR